MPGPIAAIHIFVQDLVVAVYCGVRTGKNFIVSGVGKFTCIRHIHVAFFAPVVDQQSLILFFSAVIKNGSSPGGGLPPLNM
jgi:hypothetical protein